MKNFISILLIALSLYSCTDSLDGNNANQNCGEITNVGYESFNFCGQLKENPTKPTYYIANSNEEFQKLFSVCPTFDASDLPDFTKERILGISSGPKPTGGYVIKIQSVLQNDCQILVEYYETAPGPDDIVTTAITYPTDYIVLPKSDKPIIFSKVNKIVDYITVGTYFGECSGANCYQFSKIEKYKVINYLNVSSLPENFSQLNYKALVYRDDIAAFFQKIPAEIKNLKGQTKTYGTPDSNDQGGVYFELSQAGVVSKVYLDTNNTQDQSAEVIAFKKVIQDKVAELKTKS